MTNDNPAPHFGLTGLGAQRVIDAVSLVARN